MAAVKVTPPNDFPLGLIRSHMVVIHQFLMLCDLQRVVRDLCPILYKPLLPWPQISRLHCAVASHSVRKPSITGLRLIVFGSYSCFVSCVSAGRRATRTKYPRVCSWSDGFALETVQSDRTHLGRNSFQLATKPRWVQFPESHPNKFIHFLLPPEKHRVTYIISP
jgi:hypothetical protein